jgi:predicted small metal-binding protein
MQVVHCCDLGFDCDGVVRADDEETLLKQVAEHASTVHNFEVTPEIVEKVKAAIVVED